MYRSSLLRLVVLLVCAGLSACSNRTSDPRGALRGVAAPQDALAAHRAWWSAYTTGDLAALEAHSAAGASATFSSGARMAREALLASAAANRPDSGLVLAWSEEAVAYPRDGLALVTATLDERAGNSAQVFRSIAVLDRAGGSEWKLLSLQTTRVARFAPIVALPVSGPLEEYAGRYATPKGRHLTMEVREATLWMVEPAGKAISLRPVGPGIFESGGQSPINGILRFVFSRDANGRVAAFHRLTEGRIDSFPRTP